MHRGANAGPDRVRPAARHGIAPAAVAFDVPDLEHGIFEVARVATWRLQLGTGRLEWSRNVRQVLGLDACVTIDRLEDFLQLVVSEDGDQLHGLAEEAVSGAVLPQEWEFRILDSTGDTRWLCGRGQVLPGSEPRVASGVIFDVTGRRELEEQLRDREQTLRGVVEASPDGIVVGGLDGRIRFASGGIRDVIGMAPEQLQGRRTWDFVEPAMHDEVRACATTLLHDPTAVRQLRLQLRHRGGHPVTVDCRFRLLTTGEGDADAFVVVVRDVTEQARLEGELARARRQAEAAVRAKSDYLARMSHELRTPMNSVIGFAQLLEMSELSTADRDSVARILGAGRHLLQLIDEVLDLARAESGAFTVTLEPVGLRDVVTAATALLAPQIAACDVAVAVDVDADTELMADGRRLSQVVINLVSNAIKYNRPGGRIHVRTSAPRPGWTRLAVADTGMGIDENDVPRLFAPFERLGADRSAVAGTGLGLALCRTLTHAMGGSIGCQSTIGRGTTFWVELPTAGTGPVAGDESTASSRRRRQPALQGGT